MHPSMLTMQVNNHTLCTDRLFSQQHVSVCWAYAMGLQHTCSTRGSPRILP